MDISQTSLHRAAALTKDTSRHGRNGITYRSLPRSGRDSSFHLLSTERLAEPMSYRQWCNQEIKSHNQKSSTTSLLPSVEERKRILLSEIPRQSTKRTKKKHEKLLDRILNAQKPMEPPATTRRKKYEQFRQSLPPTLQRIEEINDTDQYTQAFERHCELMVD